MRLKRIIGATMMGAFGLAAMLGLTACEMKQEGVVKVKCLEDNKDIEWCGSQTAPPGAGAPAEHSLILENDQGLIEVNISPDRWESVKQGDYFEGAGTVD